MLVKRRNRWPEGWSQLVIASLPPGWVFCQPLTSYINCFFFFFFFFFPPYYGHTHGMWKFLAWGVKSELQLQAYPTATAMPDPSCICNLCCCSLWQCQILNPLNEARDQTCIFMETMLGSLTNEPQWELPALTVLLNWFWVFENRV